MNDLKKKFKKCRKCQDQCRAKDGPRGDAGGGPQLRPLAAAAAAAADEDREQERRREASHRHFKTSFYDLRTYVSRNVITLRQ